MSQVGFDAYRSLTYYFLVHLYHDDEYDWEFAFALFEWNDSNYDHRTIYDTIEARRITDPACRENLSALLMTYAERLVAVARPTRFKMETFHANLPPRALVKYERLCDVFTELGYRVTPEPTNTGKNLWVVNEASSGAFDPVV